MRVWDVPVEDLCAKHLLGEHRELHAIWTILTDGRRGYLNHPETKRWVGRLKALYRRHDQEVAEMQRRGYVHKSPLDKKKGSGRSVQDSFVNSIDEQKILLKNKECDCYHSPA